MIVLLGDRPDATLDRLEAAAAAQGLDVVRLDAADLVHDLCVDDRIASGSARVRWRVKDRTIDADEVTGVLNRMDDLGYGAFSEVAADDRLVAWHELRAYLVFALGRFPNVIGRPDGQEWTGRGPGPYLQWLDLERGLPATAVPLRWFGRPAGAPAWISRPGRRVAVSGPNDEPDWSAVDPARLDPDRPVLIHEVPPGQPVDVRLIDDDVWVTPTTWLPDEVERRITGTARLTSAAYGLRCTRVRFFVNAEPARLTFGSLRADTDLAAAPAHLRDDLTRSMLRALTGPAGRTGSEPTTDRPPSTRVAATVLTPEVRSSPPGASVRPRRSSSHPVAAPVNLLASETDPTAAHFHRQALRRGVDVSWWRTEELLDHGDRLVDVLAAADPGHGFYVRRPGTDDPELDDRLALLDGLLRRHPGPVIGAVHRSTNHSKALHAFRLGAGSSAAIRVPPCRVRSIPRLGGANGPSVVKAVSSEKAQVRAADDLAPTADCRFVAPVLTQARVPGDNLRVHVLDGRAHAVVVRSPVLDYRFDPGFTVEPVALDATVVDWCVDAARSEGVRFAGVDLVVNGDERWCLEVNPNPGYHVFEELLDAAGHGTEVSHQLVSYLTREARTDVCPAR